MTKTVTEDGKQIDVGRWAFNYYDHEMVKLVKVDPRPEPNGALWADWERTDGKHVTLDGSRVYSVGFAIDKGWTG